jgi:hypothetical protein
MITGRGFIGATGVTFDGIPATNVTVVNYHTLSATTPVHAAGAVNVAVSTPQGLGIGNSLYTYGTPEMNILGNSLSIESGQITASTLDHTDFGSIAVAGGTAGRTFTITNSGLGELMLTGIPKVAVGGTHSADFTIAVQPTSPVFTAGSTSFQVTFNPSAEGFRDATISIASDDSDENPYTFAVQGSGLSAA